VAELVYVLDSDSSVLRICGFDSRRMYLKT
jgi:hypothetical protein